MTLDLFKPRLQTFFDEVSVSLNHALTPLSDVATVKRGIQTGANDFFCLSQADVNEHDLPEDVLTPLLRSTRLAPHYSYTPEDWETDRDDGRDCWLLYDLPSDADTDLDPAVEAYLQSGIEQGVTDAYSMKNREPWFQVDRRNPPHLVFTYMSQENLRFIWNGVGAHALNNTLGVRFNDEYSDLECLALAAYLNSPIAKSWLDSNSISYAGGMSKVEPGALADLPVLDPHSIPLSLCEELAELFGELDEGSRLYGQSADAREEIKNQLVNWYVAELRHSLDTQLARQLDVEKRMYDSALNPS